ncbi:MAG: PrsW family intramembrane metalloprotease [Spirochaetota bacterium]
MTLLIINISLAAVPSLLLLLYFYRKDVQKKEPPKLVWKIFGLGCLAVIPAAVLELIIGLFAEFFTGITFLAVRAFVIAGLVEELMKLLVVLLFVYKKDDFDEVTDGMVYAISAGLGFAFLENIMYSFGPPLALIVRGITAVPLHAIASGIMGYYIGLSKFKTQRLYKTGLLYAVLIHGTYDFLLFTGTWLSLIVIPLLIGSGKILFNLYGRALEDDRRTGRS